MKFQIGDVTDTALCIVLKHEFLRCDDAFNEFASSAKVMIEQGESKRIAYKTYNAYARFIHHLYEFILAAVARDRQDTESLKSDVAESYIAGHTQRILTSRRNAILSGTAPAWENDISFYPENVPKTFPAEFRRCRNIVSGHAIHKRSDLSLTKFYDESHKFLYLLYYDAKSWWGRESGEFPDLKEITAFTVLVKSDPSLEP
jgi:hypothetical protein